MEYLAKTGGPVTAFRVGEMEIDCVCGKRLLKLDKASGTALLEKEIFKKEGFARLMLAGEGQIVVSDFCMLHVFGEEEFAPIKSLQLGSDLSSDICALAMDGERIYCSIRNGRVIAIDRATFAILPLRRD